MPRKRPDRLPAMSEDELLRHVIQLARLRGWRTAHFRPGLTRTGRWVTPVQGDGKGWPDLVLVKGDTGAGQIIFAELKRDGAMPTLEQITWMDALRAVGMDVRLWRPADWESIKETLLGDGS